MEAAVALDEDFTSHLIYQGKGYTVHENRDRPMDETWFTLCVNTPNPVVTADALGFFISENMVILDSCFDGQTLIIDLAYA